MHSRVIAAIVIAAAALAGTASAGESAATIRGTVRTATGSSGLTITTLVTPEGKTYVVVPEQIGEELAAKMAGRRPNNSSSWSAKRSGPGCRRSPGPC